MVGRLILHTKHIASLLEFYSKCRINDNENNIFLVFLTDLSRNMRVDCRMWWCRDGGGHHGGPGMTATTTVDGCMFMLALAIAC